ncbi:hypothetical protein EC973_001638 [Apophysomyces ossiformis]|uniref:BHLH domain-containing protein n=1 Tax=Apophysomyces ossiformis TaxID=679940 RepID=A0A8H7ESN9_9FUNG|nr:hypothetical protein EC973_001638 [Apophysomyces ossiformis]
MALSPPESVLPRASMRTIADGDPLFLSTPLVTQEVAGDVDFFQRRHSIHTGELNTRSNNPYGITSCENRAPSDQVQNERPSSVPSSPPFLGWRNIRTLSPQPRSATLSDRTHTHQQRQSERDQHELGAPYPYSSFRHIENTLGTNAAIDSKYALPRRTYMPVVRHGAGTERTNRSAYRSEATYSRSPELRISHKLAERKRRKEMKELFDELRQSLPVEKNMKTSKWEILSKAVEYITVLKHRDYDMKSEINRLRQEISALKQEQGYL